MVPYLRYLPWVLTGFGAVLLFPLSKPLSLVSLLLFIVGLRDYRQTRHAILRNYPLTGHLRGLLEQLRPRIRRHFVEGDDDQLPFSRNQRAMVYARSRRDDGRRGFGSITPVYGADSEWMVHSAVPKQPDPKGFRVRIGGPQCRQPYVASVFNISAMSFGALSANAILALNRGAKLGGFAHDTGEGSISKYHRELGGDLIWEIGTGYFGCRTAAGHFDADKFAQQAQLPQVKMIEIKLSQGAHPGQGGLLPAAKVTSEVASWRGVPMAQDCISPAVHEAFSTPLELMSFISKLRDLSGGKPVGIKLCIGMPGEWFAMAKAMLVTGIFPDFIVIDGSEGGSGAAPFEFAGHVGMPMRDGLRLVHNTLVGMGVRDTVRIGAAGKIVAAFDIARTLAIGADWCNAARGFMFALGCVQSRICHTDRCPTGIATQDSDRQRALVVPDKANRVKNFHEQTVAALATLAGAAGLDRPGAITADYLMVRDTQGRAVTLASTLPTLEHGVLLDPGRLSQLPEPFRSQWVQASADHFERRARTRADAAVAPL